MVLSMLAIPTNRQFALNNKRNLHPQYSCDNPTSARRTSTPYLRRRVYGVPGRCPPVVVRVSAIRCDSAWELLYDCRDGTRLDLLSPELLYCYLNRCRCYVVYLTETLITCKPHVTAIRSFKYCQDVVHIELREPGVTREERNV